MKSPRHIRTTLVATCCCLLAMPAIHAQGISIFTANAAGEDITTSDFIHDFDTTVRSNADHVLVAGPNTDIQMAAGKHLVIYNSRFDDTQDANAARSEIQTKLHLNGSLSALPMGWSQGYIRRNSNQFEAITAGGAIIDVPVSGNTLQLRSMRTDNNSDDIIREPDNTGIQLVKLDDSWDYLLLAGHNGSGSDQTIQNGNNTVDYTDVLEKDAGSFGDTSDGVTLLQNGHYLVLANTYIKGTNGSNKRRTGITQHLTLDNVPVVGSRTMVYLRGATTESADEGAVTIGMIIEASAGQVLKTLISREDSNVAADIIGERTAITMVKLPDTADYIRLTDIGNLQNINGATLTYDTQVEIDGSFTHDTSTNADQIGVSADGDYLFFASQFDADVNVTRVFYNQGWKVNESAGLLSYGQTGSYGRNATDSNGIGESLGNWSGFVSALTASDYVQTATQALGAGGDNWGDELALQGIRIDNIFGPDVTPPAISTTNPAMGDLDVYLGTTQLVANFNEQIALTGAGTIILVDTDDGSSSETFNLPSGQVTVSGNQLIITPTVSLESGANYEVTIEAGVLRDTATVPNAYDGTGASEWTFRITPFDSIGPIPTPTSPADDAINVAPGVDLVATFDEDLILGSGNITLVDLTDGSGNQTIAVTGPNVSIVGTVMTIDPPLELEGATNYAVHFDAGVVKNFSDVGNLAITDNTTWNFSATDTTVYNGATGNFNLDTWNDAANWSAGVPTGSLNAVIDPGQYASVSQNYSMVPCPSYTGNLTLGAGATLEIAQSSNNTDLNALGGDTITMNTGSIIAFRRGADTVHAQDIVMAGDARIDLCRSTSAHVRDRSFNGEISGAGRLSVQGVSRNNGYFNGNNASWSGGLRAYNGNSMVFGGAANSLGTGDITIDNSMSLGITAANAMGDTATLNLNGNPGSDNGTARTKLVMNASDTIGFLNIDGYPQPAGTYGRTGIGGVDYELDIISGNGILTVTGEPADSTAPTATFDAVGAGGSTTDVFATEPVTYTLTFSEPLSTSLELSDLENSGTASISIESVTDISSDLTSNLVYQVRLQATTIGTLNLQVRSGTMLTDLFGNALVTPAADNDTLNVNGLPLIQGELGLWKPWANGGINPATGSSWAVGDTYRIVFASSTTVRDATSAVMQDYHDAITTYANNAGLAGNWYVVGTTDGTNGRDNTLTTGTGLAILATNGYTKIADNYNDFWDNSLDNPIRYDESGNQLGSLSIATGMNANGTQETSRILGGSSESPPKITHGRTTDTGTQWARVYNGNASNQWRFYGMSAVLTLQGAPAPYDIWASGTFTNPFTNTLRTQNDDTDDMRNLLEFAFGTDPTVNDQGRLTYDGSSFTYGGPDISVTAAGPGAGVNFKARFIRRTDHGQSGSVNYVWRFSSDMTVWEDSDDNPDWYTEPFVLDTQGNYQLVEVVYPFFLDSFKKARFFQVEVTAVP